MAESVIVRPLVAMGVVLPLKRDVGAIEGEQPMIADRDAGVAPEISQDGRRASEGRLGVDTQSVSKSLLTKVCHCAGSRKARPDVGERN